MPVIDHKNLSESNLHEDKGASSATSGQVYIANGAGSGVWGIPTVGAGVVTDSMMDWTNNKAVSLQQYMSSGALRKTTITQNTTSWIERDEAVHIYKPTNSSVLAFYAEYEMTAGTTDEIEIRVKTNTKTGTIVTVPTTKAAKSSTLDVSDKTGWLDLQLESRSINTNNHTAVIYQLVFYFV